MNKVVRNAMIYGYLEDAPDRPYKASFWNVPNGYEVDKAEVCVAYFDDQESRDLFVWWHKDDESMASVC